MRPASGWDRETLVALNLAREQVARIGVNLNQAVAALNATGEAPIWLDRAVGIAARVVLRLEDAADEVSAGLAPAVDAPSAARGVIGKVVKRRAGGAIELIAYLYREGPAGREGPVSRARQPTHDRLVGRRSGRTGAAHRAG